MNVRGTFALRIAVALLDFTLGSERSDLLDALPSWSLDRMDARSRIVSMTCKAPENLTVSELLVSLEKEMA